MPASRPPPKTKPHRCANSRRRLRKVFREKTTGTTADRPQLRALMKKLTPGDVRTLIDRFRPLRGDFGTPVCANRKPSAKYLM